MIPWWENTRTWTTKKGEVLTLETVPRGHRRNIIAWIYKHGETLRFAMGLQAAFETAWVEENMGDGAFFAASGREAWIEDAPLADVIESTPLMKRLRELEAQS